MYKQEALIPARPMAVDMIFPHSWDSICKDELGIHKGIGRNVCRARRQRWLKDLEWAGEE